MLRQIRDRLRKIPFLHNSYMRVKRRLSTELLGMTTLTEQQYLSKYGESQCAGVGEVVDLGCWLGSTTIPLTNGLLKNPAFADSGRKVHSYDLFEWYDWMESSVAGSELSGKYREGDSFVDEFKRRIEPIADHVEIYAGDLKQIGWNGGEIEFLLVDAMKGWDLAASITKDFYPSLTAGQSLVFHQDFAHHFTPWIHLIQWQLKDHFEYVEEVPNSQSVVFRCIKQIQSSDVNLDWGFDLFDDETVDAAFAYSMSLVSKEKLPNVAAAKVMWFLHQDENEEANMLFTELLANGIPLESEMKLIKEKLSSV
ncbi:MAG TPA: hypothetical protein PKA82_02765 [Pyrinomonadaceae bacterium]|nr:hypothetical protein [Pyrinomonadaceae bacterium]